MICSFAGFGTFDKSLNHLLGKKNEVERLNQHENHMETRGGKRCTERDMLSMSLINVKFAT